MSLVAGCAQAASRSAGPPVTVAPAEQPAAAPASQAPEADSSPWPFAPHAGAIEEKDALVVVVEDGAIRVNGAPAGSTQPAVESGGLRKLEGLFDSLRTFRDLWKQNHPTLPFPGAVLLRVSASTPMVAVKSVFQTAAYAGYPNIGFVARTGKGDGVLRAEAQIPGPPDPDSEIGLGPAPVHTLVVQAAPAALTATWKDGAEVLSEERHPRSLLVAPTPAAPQTSPALVEALRSAWAKHALPAAPGRSAPSKRLLVGVDNSEPCSTLFALLDAIEAVREGTGEQFPTVFVMR